MLVGNERVVFEPYMGGWCWNALSLILASAKRSENVSQCHPPINGSNITLLLSTKRGFKDSLTSQGWCPRLIWWGDMSHNRFSIVTNVYYCFFFHCWKIIADRFSVLYHPWKVIWLFLQIEKKNFLSRSGERTRTRTILKQNNIICYASTYTQARALFDTPMQITNVIYLPRRKFNR